MIQTGVTATLGVFDESARPDAAYTVEAGGIQPFTTFEGFYEEKVNWEKWATLERDQFRLDGSFAYWPEDKDMAARQDWGVWGTEYTGATGVLRTPVVVYIRFGSAHACRGLTFHFHEPCGEWAGEIYIEYYREDGRPVSYGIARPDSANYYWKNPVDRFTAIRLEFRSYTPYRYFKWANIDYGKLMHFDGSNIISAKLVESISQDSSQLCANEASFEVYSLDKDFSIIDPFSIAAGLRQRQKMDIHGFVEEDGERQDYYMGRFYLKDWDAASDSVSSLKLQSVIGNMGSVSYPGGIYDTTAGRFFAEVLDGYQYEIDPELATRPIKGWLPATTCRDALLLGAFASRAILDTSRSSVIRIYPRVETAQHHLTYGRQFVDGNSLKVKEAVTGVRVMHHTYTPGPEANREELHKATGLAAGREEVASFSEPCHGYKIEGGVITKAHPNFVEYTASGGDVVITGIKYIDSTGFVELGYDDTPADTEENLIEPENTTLVCPEAAKPLAEYLLGYHGQRYKLGTSIVLTEGERLGATVVAQTLNGQDIRGTIEQMSIDLANGFVADLTVSGARVDTAHSWFLTADKTPPELVMDETGENGGIV